MRTATFCDLVGFAVGRCRNLGLHIDRSRSGFLARRQNTLIDTYVQLKGELVEYASTGPFMHEWAAGIPDGDDFAVTMFTDMFITSGEALDGKSLIEHFVDARPDFDDEARAILRSWIDGAVTQLYEIRGRDGTTIRTTGVIDELDYSAEVTMGAGAARRIAKGKYLFTRLLPVGDLWVMSGPQLSYPAKQEREALELAVRWATSQPESVFRNPDLLEKGWELQRRDRSFFCEFFGSDQVILPAEEARARVAEYWTWRFAQGREASEAEAPEGFFPLDDEDLIGVETVGLLYDEVEGLSFLRDYQRLLAAFDDPKLMRRRMWKTVVSDYLQAEEIGPAPLRRAAGADPAKADRVFSLLLGRKGFSWDRDGEELLRRNKPSWFATEPRPSQIPFNDRLAEALRAQRR
jgi:hypothetical protein